MSVRNEAIIEDELKFYMETNKAIITSSLCPPLIRTQREVYPGQRELFSKKVNKMPDKSQDSLVCNKTPE